jgi:hypothetical protein
MIDLPQFRQRIICFPAMVNLRRPDRGVSTLRRERPPLEGRPGKEVKRPFASPSQREFQEWRGAGFLRSHDFLRRTLSDDLAAGVAVVSDRPMLPSGN